MLNQVLELLEGRFATGTNAAEQTVVALRGAEQARQAAGDGPGGLFGCTVIGQHCFAAGAHLTLGDTEAALEAAEPAFAATPIEQRSYNSITMARINASVACVLADDLDNALHRLAQVADLPAEQRLDTFAQRLHRPTRWSLTVPHWDADHPHTGDAPAPGNPARWSYRRSPAVTKGSRSAMTVIAIPTDNTHQARPERAVTGVNPLRARNRVRGLLRRELLTAADLVAPVLVQPDHRDPADYRHLPGAVALSEVAAHARELAEAGVRAVKLFAYVENKTSDAAEALEPNNLLVVAVQAIRTAVEDMVISTEVCGCAWTNTGECVLLGLHGRTDTPATYELMARMAVLHAQAGADIIGPAAVLDGSVRAIRAELDDAGYRDVGITPSVIFDSALFTAYKDAMHTDPGRGNRRGFQIDACHTGQALDQAARWLSEGADSLLVQPAMVSVDVLTRLRATVNVPLTSFSVSGEDQLMASAPDAVYLEYARSLKRVGADLIMTYGALRLARAVAGDDAA